MGKSLKINLILCLVLIYLNSPGFCQDYKSQTQEPVVSEEEMKILREVIELSEKDLGGALKFLEPKITSDCSAALDFALGNLYFQKDELEEAKDSYQKALKKFPGFNRARANLARVLIRQDKIDEAIREFQRILLTGAPKPSTLTLIGYTFLLKNQPVSAETAYRHALLLQPDDTNARLGLVKCLLQQERFREAIKLLEELLEAHPQRQELWSLLANANLALDKPGRAIIALECARALGIASPDALATLGDLYLNCGQAATASAVYKKAFAVERPSMNRLLRAAEGFIMLAQPAGAAALLERARSIEQDNHLTFTPRRRRRLHWLEACYAHLKGDSKTAFRAYEQLLEEDPLNGDALLALGDLHRDAEELEEALIVYERAARVSDKKVEALVRQAQVEIERERYCKAVELLEASQAIKPQPNVARYLDQVRRLVR